MRASTIGRRPVSEAKRSSPGRTPPVTASGRDSDAVEVTCTVGHECGADVGQFGVEVLPEAGQEGVQQPELGDATALPAVPPFVG